MRRLYREQIGKRLRKGDVVGLALSVATTAPESAEADFGIFRM